MQHLYETSAKLIKETPLSFKRGLFHKIKFPQKLIEITGSRGVGKTTMMLQMAKEIYAESPEKVLYFSLDDAYFFNHSITETAEQFEKYGGEYLFIDEVHKYPAKHKNFDWSSELKNIYDLHSKLNVTYSGSSIIKIYKGQGDLSRRKSSYTLNGFSFREYLEFNNIFEYSTISLAEIINNNITLSSDISDKIKILPHFKDYLSNGYYPFYNENPQQYINRIKSVINVILETDIPSVADINYDTIGMIKIMLAALSTAVPYTPNISKLSYNLQISDTRTMYKYFYFLEKAELISLLNTSAKANKKFQKPDKIYLNNSNLIKALTPNKSETGTIRETFFHNQLNYLHKINYPKKADFIVDDKYIFEIGEENKTSKQIKDLKNAYIVKDDIEIGFTNQIPLWLFGFLY